jgi:uncharacterized membrane protein
MEPGEGERLYAQRRKRFWMLLGTLALLGMVAGFVAGFAADFADAREMTVEPLYGTVGAAGVILMVILVAYFSWRFFVSVDEVEVADNLWGSLFGLYTYALLLPAWWALARLAKAPEPDHWVIYGASMIVATAVYGYRKWRSTMTD